MKEPIVRSYVAVTIDAAPKVYVLDESRMTKKFASHGVIFHCWLRHKAGAIIGIKFSSWMIKSSTLSKAEKSAVEGWNKSATDYEVYFGSEREYANEEASDDESGLTYLLRLDSKQSAICFPLHGSSLAKADVDLLSTTLVSLDPPPLPPPPPEE